MKHEEVHFEQISILKSIAAARQMAKKKGGVMLFTTATLQHSKAGYQSSECRTTAVWKTLMVAGPQPNQTQREREEAGTERDEWVEEGTRRRLRDGDRERPKGNMLKVGDMKVRTKRKPTTAS